MAIPKRIIQTGRSSTQLSLLERAGRENVRLLNPGYEYQFYDDAAVESFVDREFSEYRPVFDAFRVPIQRYDFFRYLAIYRYGGFYFDLDVLLAAPLDPLLERDCVFPFEGLTLNTVLRRRHNMDWQIGNYAFGAVPGHPFVGAIIENCVRGQRDPAWVDEIMRGALPAYRVESFVLNTTGPGVVTRTLIERPDLARGVNVLFPDDVCDPSGWNHFGDFGTHFMVASWRDKRTPVRRKLAELWERWLLRRRLAESRALGKSRQGGEPVRRPAPRSRHDSAEKRRAS